MPSLGSTYYFIHRHRENKGGFFMAQKEKFVFQSGVSALDKIAGKYQDNRNHIRDFYTFSNE